MIYFPNILPKLHPLSEDEVATRIQEYDSLTVADEPDRVRGIRNMMIATGLRYDQWANNWNLLQQMLEEGRGPTAYNFIQFLIRGIAGNMIMNWFDPKFVDKEGDDKDVLAALSALQKAYYAHKEHYDYKASAISRIWNGLTYRGIEELVIDRSEDPRGAIRFESIRPDMVVFDNSNLGDRISRDSRKAFKRFYLLDKEALRYFPHMEDAMRRAISRPKGDDKDRPQVYEEVHIGSFRDPVPHFNSRRLYVEEYEIEWEKARVAIHSESGVEFPDSGHELGSEEDFVAKVLWGTSNGLDVGVDTIAVVDKSQPFLYTTTLCKELGLMLEHRKDERQLGEHLPLYAWSFLEKCGKSIGAVDLLVDCQDDLNKRNNQATKVFTQSMLNGKTWIHPDAYGGSDTKRQEMIENLNDSASPLILDEDAPVGVNLFGVTQSQGPNPALFADPATKIDYMNRIVSLPMAMQGFTERSGESGIHLGRKVIEGSIMQRLPLEGLLQSENEKAEDWLRVAIKKYRGPANYNRTFSSGDSRMSVTVNKYMGRDGNGEPIIEADIGRLSVDRIDVIVTQSKENDFMRQAKRETDAAILNSLQPTATNGAAIASFVTDLMMSSDFSDEQQREKTEQAAKLYWDLEMTNGNVMLKEAKIRELQIDARLAQMLGGAGGEMPPGAVPPGAAGSPTEGMPTAAEGAPGPEPAPGPIEPGERLPVEQPEIMREGEMARA